MSASESDNATYSAYRIVGITEGDATSLISALSTNGYLRRPPVGKLSYVCLAEHDSPTRVGAKLLIQGYACLVAIADNLPLSDGTVTPASAPSFDVR